MTDKNVVPEYEAPAIQDLGNVTEFFLGPTSGDIPDGGVPCLMMTSIIWGG